MSSTEISRLQNREIPWRCDMVPTSPKKLHKCGNRTSKSNNKTSGNAREL